jgi:hypothetical protein
VNASPIIVPNGFSATKRREPLSKAEVKLVTEFEAWCQKRGLALDLLCKHCLDAGEGPNSRCFGNNTRDSLQYTISCNHLERVYGKQ